MNQVSFFEKLKNPALHYKDKHLETNVWPGRNKVEIANLEETLFEWNIRDVDLVVVGAGGISRFFEKMLPAGTRKEIGFWKRVGQKLVGAIETEARNRLTRFGLSTTEPIEIYDSLIKRIGIRSTTFVDKYREVLQGVERLKIPNSRYLMLNLENPNAERDIPEGDVVIAYNVLTYCRNQPARAQRNITQMVRPRGFLDLHLPQGYSQTINGFTKTARGPYYRGEREDKQKVKFDKFPIKHRELDHEEIYYRARAASPEASRVTKTTPPETLFPNAQRD